MPLFGSLDVTARGAEAPVVDTLADDTWEAEQSEILYLIFEYAADAAFQCIPPALHPALPPFGGLMFRHHPTSPVGPYTLAELRVTARAGVHYVGYCTGGFVDNPDAVQMLRDRYGWPVQQADVRLRRRYYGVEGRVELDGKTIADCRLEKPQIISGKDVLYTANMHLAQIDGRPRLAQVEAEYTFHRAERGAAHLSTLDTGAFGEARLKPTNPLPATMTQSTVKYREIRFLVEPDKPALHNTERIA